MSDDERSTRVGRRTNGFQTQPPALAPPRLALKDSTQRPAAQQTAKLRAGTTRRAAEPLVTPWTMAAKFLSRPRCALALARRFGGGYRRNRHWVLGTVDRADRQGFASQGGGNKRWFRENRLDELVWFNAIARFDAGSVDGKGRNGGCRRLTMDFADPEPIPAALLAPLTPAMFRPLETPARPMPTPTPRGPATFVRTIAGLRTSRRKRLLATLEQTTPLPRQPSARCFRLLSVGRRAIVKETRGR
jgi:hypothetical protein